MTHSSLTNRIQLTSESSPRPSKIDRFIVHHAATTSLDAILSLFQPGGRSVSANYALGSDGTLVLAVDEDRRAWTSSSATWDGRAVTIEVANSIAGGSWPVSDVTFDKLARLIADVSYRYGFPINDDTILTHQELYTRYGESYATACPGDLQRRKGELLALANRYRSSGTAGGNARPIEQKQGDTPMIKATVPGGSIGIIGEFVAHEYTAADQPQSFSWGANGKAYGSVDLTQDEFTTLKREAANRRAALVNDVAAAVIAKGGVGGAAPAIDYVALAEALKASGIGSQPIDYAKFAEAVNDDAARRLAD